MAMTSSAAVVKMLANFASHVTSSHVYEARAVTRVENVSSWASTRIRNSAPASCSASGVIPASGLSAVIGCTTVQCSVKNSTDERSSASWWKLRSRLPPRSSNHPRLTRTRTSLSSPGCAFTMRNISPRPPS